MKVWVVIKLEAEEWPGFFEGVFKDPHAAARYHGVPLVNWSESEDGKDFMWERPEDGTTFTISEQEVRE